MVQFHYFLECPYKTIGNVSTFAGSVRGTDDGPLLEAKFHFLGGMAKRESDGAIFVCDSENHTIRKILNGTLNNRAYIY